MSEPVYSNPEALLSAMKNNHDAFFEYSHYCEKTHCTRYSTFFVDSEKFFVVQSDGSSLNNGTDPDLAKLLRPYFDSQQIVDVSARLKISQHQRPDYRPQSLFFGEAPPPKAVPLSSSEARRVALNSYVSERTHSRTWVLE